jgi:hypothetical protein
MESRRKRLTKCDTIDEFVLCDQLRCTPRRRASLLARPKLAAEARGAVNKTATARVGGANAMSEMRDWLLKNKLEQFV